MFWKNNSEHQPYCRALFKQDLIHPKEPRSTSPACPDILSEGKGSPRSGILKGWSGASQARGWTQDFAQGAEEEAQDGPATSRVATLVVGGAGDFEGWCVIFHVLVVLNTLVCCSGCCSLFAFEST